MSNRMRTQLFIAALCGTFASVSSLHAQRAAPSSPAQPMRLLRPATPIEITLPADALQEAPGIEPEEADAARIGPDEAKRLKAIYEGLAPDEQEQMRLLYEAMGSTCSRSSCRTIPRPCGSSRCFRR